MTAAHTTPIMTETELQNWGIDHIAYVRAYSGAEVAKMFPNDGIPVNAKLLYVARHADGAAISVSDTLAAAHGNLIEQELEIASVH